jgi:hypothetical protein
VKNKRAKFRKEERCVCEKGPCSCRTLNKKIRREKRKLV